MKDLLRNIDYYSLIKKIKKLDYLTFNILKQNVSIILRQKIPYFFKKHQLFTFLVCLPFLFYSFYIIFIKSTQYQSSAKILIEQSNTPAAAGLYQSLLGQNAPQKDNFLVKNFLMSKDALNHLNKSLQLKDYFQSKEIDFFSRLSKNTSAEDFLKYYQSKIYSAVEPETQEIVIIANAFSPQMARTIITELIQQSKIFVNKISNTLAQKQFDFAQKQLNLAKQKLFKANKSLVTWQNSNGMFNPKEAAQVVSTVMSKLKGTLVEKQTEFMTLSAFMQPSSNKLITLQEEINALKQQVERQTSILLGNNKSNQKLNQVVSEFEWFQLQLTFAQTEYQAAEQAYETASLNLIRNQNIVIEIQPPELPEEIYSPKVFYDMVNFFVVMLMIFVLTKVGITLIKEHID